MQMVTGRFTEGFCKNTVYRFLSAAKTNWDRFVLLLSEWIINRTIRPLTNKDRRDVFIIDDTLFARTGGKRTELCSKVFDHVSMKYRRGYRLLTFKTCKSMLHLGSEWHSLSYDALNAHVSLVFVR